MKHKARDRKCGRRKGHGMKHYGLRFGGLWTLLKRIADSWFGPIERSKYRGL